MGHGCTNIISDKTINKQCVAQVTGSQTLKLVHDRYKGKPSAAALRELADDMASAAQANEEISQHLGKVMEDLSALRVSASPRLEICLCDFVLLYTFFTRNAMLHRPYEYRHAAEHTRKLGRHRASGDIWPGMPHLKPSTTSVFGKVCDVPFVVNAAAIDHLFACMRLATVQYAPHQADCGGQFALWHAPKPLSTCLCAVSCHAARYKPAISAISKPSQTGSRNCCGGCRRLTRAYRCRCGPQFC